MIAVQKTAELLSLLSFIAPAGAVCLTLDEQACKPGSVENDHLSRPAVADRLKPPPEDGRAGHMSSHGVAPDRVYSVSMSPWDE